MENLSSLKSKLLAEQVEEQLMQYIQQTPVSVGEKLPNEFKLGELFGVGRSTIREAVKSLVTKGILEIRRGAGTYVVNATTNDDDPLGLRNVEDKISLALNLVEVRLILEPSIAEIAAIHATEEDVQKLYRICDQIEEAIANGDNYIPGDLQFHSYIAECTKNKVMEQLIPIIDTAVMMFVNVTHKELIQETIRTHRQIVNAIARKDYVGARTAMTMHLAYNRDKILEMKQEQDRNLN
ncbi:MAG: FadR/GntR family transcriptional regulator [Lachnospiraceae bacterium]|nr:FadR/GntR family transcriptional regulator [Lachnospiraceae bacterium]